MMVFIFSAVFFCFAMFGLSHVRRLNLHRMGLVQPTLVEAWDARSLDLVLNSKGDISRWELQQARGRGGSPAVEKLLREKFSCSFDTYSIDYRYACFNEIIGKNIPAEWTSTSANESRATVFFYSVRNKPEPVPEPTVTRSDGWSERDEEDRIRLFLHDPKAFWLNPDWSDRSQPFWMRDPAPLPERPQPQQRMTKKGEAVRIMLLADALDDQVKLMTRDFVSGPSEYYLNGGRVSSEELNQARKLRHNRKSSKWKIYQ